MKVRTIIQIALIPVILGLGYLLFQTIWKDIKFDNEFNARRESCAQRLKIIRSLEEAYKQTYGVYQENFDTLIYRLMNEDSLMVTKEEYDTVVIKKAIADGVLLKDSADSKKTFEAAIKEIQNLSSDIQREKRYVYDTVSWGNALAELRKNKSNKDFIVKDAKTGVERSVTDEEIRNSRYVPGYGDKKEFHLRAKELDGVWVFMAWIDFRELFEDSYKEDDYKDLKTVKVDTVLLNNLMADRDNQTKALMAKDSTKYSPVYNSWRVGDTLKPETRGNFE